MDSRMSKYGEETVQLKSRVSANEELYKNLNKSELDNFNLNNNTTVIGDSKKEIDIDKIKKILDTKYNENAPQRKSIRLEQDDSEITYETELESTKEYDINVILEKAKDEKVSNYEEDRLKKLRDTQFDILNNLDFNKKEDKTTSDKENLLELINTITINEDKIKEAAEEKESTSLFSHLKEDDVEDTKENETVETTLVNKVADKKDDQVVTSTITSIKNNSLDTTNVKFNKKDFENLNLDDGKRNIITEILVVIILIAFVVGMYLFFSSILNF